MVKGVYNLYEDDTLVLENVYPEDIQEYLGNDKINVPHYASHATVYGKRYTMEKGDPEPVVSEFAREWNEAIAPFKRVKWVKSGGRKLGGY